jgi:prephenate dehydrogenase
MPGMQWRKVTLVGVGLLGGSLGLALKQRRLAGCVHGYVRRESAVAECLKAGAVDQAGLDLTAAVQGADLIVLCTPIAQMRLLVERLGPALGQGALVTDVGSVKAVLARELEPLVGSQGAFFVGSHPMAGSERMGVAEARADLFVNAACVITPTAQSAPGQVNRLEQLWSAVGGLPLILSPQDHDELVCRSSHLPHVLASILARFVLDPAWPPAQARLCANGFRDATRIASGSPEMWRDICVANRQQLDRVLQVFMGHLEAFRALLEPGREEELERYYVESKQRRDQWQSRGASPSPE